MSKQSKLVAAMREEADRQHAATRKNYKWVDTDSLGHHSSDMKRAEFRARKVIVEALTRICDALEPRTPEELEEENRVRTRSGLMEEIETNPELTKKWEKIKKLVRPAMQEAMKGSERPEEFDHSGINKGLGTVALWTPGSLDSNIDRWMREKVHTYRGAPMSVSRAVDGLLREVENANR